MGRKPPPPAVPGKMIIEKAKEAAHTWIISALLGKALPTATSEEMSRIDTIIENHAAALLKDKALPRLEREITKTNAIDFNHLPPYLRKALKEALKVIEKRAKEESKSGQWGHRPEAPFSGRIIRDSRGM